MIFSHPYVALFKPLQDCRIFFSIVVLYCSPLHALQILSPTTDHRIEASLVYKSVCFFCWWRRIMKSSDFSDVTHWKSKVTFWRKMLPLSSGLKNKRPACHPCLSYRRRWHVPLKRHSTDYTTIKHKYFASIATKYSLAHNYIHYMFRPTWAILRWTLRWTCRSLLRYMEV
jgi:hypothetical protein